MGLYVLDKNVLHKYTDDDDLIEKTDLFLKYFT